MNSTDFIESSTVTIGRPSLQMGLQNISTRFDHQYFPDTVLNLLQKLSTFKQLAPNWDSYGAEAPSPIAIGQAMHFLTENHYLSLPFYFIATGVNGEVLLEFQEGDKAAEIYFNPDGSTELLLFQNNDAVLEGSLAEHFPNLIDHFRN